MQKILFKMHLTKHKITIKYPEEMNILRKVLSNFQEHCWHLAMNYPREAFPELSIDLVKYVKKNNFRSIFEKIGCDKDIASYRDPFDLWATFLLLAGFIYNPLDTLKKVLEKIPVESYPEEVRDVQKSVDTQLSIWDQILDDLGDHLVPYSHLVKIFCNDLFCIGERMRCFSCRRDTTVEMVKQEIGGDAELRPFISEYTSWVSCHREACFIKIYSRHGDALLVLLRTFLGKLNASFKCDYCFCRCEKVHRCSRCLTKQYCSKECKGKDWKEAHEKVCKPGEDPDKVKEDRTGRNAERDQNIAKQQKIKEDLNKKPSFCKGPPICRCCSKP